MSEESGTPVSVLGTHEGSDPRPLLEVPGALFPGPPDPKNTHALLIHAAGEGEAHLESLILVKLDGTGHLQLGASAQAVRNPTWAPDGTVVFESSERSFRDLYRADRLGKITRLTTTEKGSFDPTVHPDGRIAFASSRDGDAELYVMQPDGTGVKRLTQARGGDMHPRWSPDGRLLTWLAMRGETVTTQRMDAQGNHAAPVRFRTGQHELDQGLQWSPDSELLAITVQTGPKDVGIDLVGLDGKRARRIHPKGVSEYPSWSGDGRHLYFSHAPPDSEPELYRLDITDPKSTMQKLTHNTHADWLVRWLPSAE